MKFNNKQNELIKDTTGREHWISRSCATVGVILGIYANEVYVLTERRSSKMEEPNKWAVISGYVDWDESAYEAVIRETYEETSFNIPANEMYLVFDNNKDPFYVLSDPKKDARQNISLSYIFIFDFYKLPIDIEKYKNSEISEVKWMNVKNIHNHNLKWAFEHQHRIQMTLDKFKNYLIL